VGFCFFKGLLGLLCASVLGVTFLFCMATSLRPLSIQDAPCSHCFGFYTLDDLSMHVKSVHLHVSLVSQAIQVASFLQVSSPPMLHPSFIPLAF
jgi:hypothetical protein